MSCPNCDPDGPMKMVAIHNQWEAIGEIRDSLHKHLRECYYAERLHPAGFGREAIEALEQAMYTHERQRSDQAPGRSVGFSVIGPNGFTYLVDVRR